MPLVHLNCFPLDHLQFRFCNVLSYWPLLPLKIRVNFQYLVPAMGSLTPFVILVEFIEVCFNLFLHSRAIYPTSFFIPTAFFGIPVLKCRHPILGGYLQTILASIGELIKLNSVYALAIVKYEKESKDPMEKLSFFVKSVENPMLPLSMERLLFIKAKLSALVLKLFDDVPCKTNTSSSVATNFYVLVKVKDETPDMKQLLSPVALWYAPIGYSSANDAIGAPLISKMPLSESSLKSEIEIDLSLESSQ